MASLSQIENHLKKYGWVVVELPNSEPVFAARSALSEELIKLTGEKDISLEKYHKFAKNDLQHTELQIQLTQFFRSQRWGPKIIKEQVGFLNNLLGRDINVQSQPYLRITRPKKPQDNIGYHRDTFYGGSPFELSILIPYVDVPVESALSVLSGSHLQPESDFPTTQIQNEDVEKGSAKHQLGFLYAPKLIDPSCTVDMQPIPLKLGEALIFNLATVHGSVENNGICSRWSSDIRVVNALAPVDLSMRPTYYEKLSRSIITEIAEIYHNNESTTCAKI
ncbi:phytanoyl-CoA dioxygenase family protein [Lusitaniella coriacea]|uniref:phytanoyl-CoA dioxygenase family protein n=1 Tax=Lusitaniella coriacea TaxID=1983105 RepID=UPI003CF0FCD7